ncbi:hypothetical protein PanWU01x14_158500, partial [Parasponia andersonii]
FYFYPSFSHLNLFLPPEARIQGSGSSGYVLLVSSMEKTLIPKLGFLKSLEVSMEEAVVMVL